MSDGFVCPYMGEPRIIHPEVCKWHRERSDPECSKCPRNAGGGEKK